MTSVRRAAAGTVGIDLGTTFSAVAKVNALGKAEILPNRDGENITPSVVFFADQGRTDTVLVGTMAAKSAVMAPDRVCQFVKRSMGDPGWRFYPGAPSGEAPGPRPLGMRGGRTPTAWRPEEISALILRKLAEDASKSLGAEVTEAVITVPAYFDDAARQATIDAGSIAGLTVRRVINEPTAAALAYGIGTARSGSNRATALVYDLGGGTFDVTAMRLEDDEFTVLATHGDRNLGGYDFDNVLMTVINERLCVEHGISVLDAGSGTGPAAVQQLRERAELAKRSLTTVDQARVTITHQGDTGMVTVTRAEFEDATSALLSRTRDIAELVVEEAGLTWHGVDRILLAGGSTRMHDPSRGERSCPDRRPARDSGPLRGMRHGRQAGGVGRSARLHRLATLRLVSDPLPPLTRIVHKG